MRKTYNSQFKAKVALEAARNVKPIAELASKYELHPTQITQWKKLLQQNAPDIFSGKKKKIKQDSELEKAKLYEQIGRLKVELDWVKKKSAILAD
jgi:transposase-like protein